MIDYLLELNNRILLAINGAHTGFLDTFMMIATNRWTWIPLYVAAFVYLIYRYGWLRAVSVLAVIGITITIADQLCGSLIRDSLQILRPSNPDNPLSAQIQLVDGYRGGRYGFPSCHAANCTALMMVLGTVIRRRWAWLVLTAYVLLFPTLSRRALSIRHPRRRGPWRRHRLRYGTPRHPHHAPPPGRQTRRSFRGQMTTALFCIEGEADGSFVLFATA